MPIRESSLEAAEEEQRETPPKLLPLVCKSLGGVGMSCDVALRQAQGHSSCWLAMSKRSTSNGAGGGNRTLFLSLENSYTDRCTTPADTDGVV